MKYNSTSKFDIAKRIQLNIPLSRKQISANKKRQNSKRDIEIRAKMEANKKDVFSDAFELVSSDKINGEYLSIPNFVG